jgi:hypothetical protein
MTLVLAATLLTAPAASASPTSPLCDDGSYRSRHPLICDTGQGGPFTIGSGGGGSDGGLLGTVGRLLHGLTGGIL